jgi:hypothetical protein
MRVRQQWLEQLSAQRCKRQHDCDRQRQCALLCSQRQQHQDNRPGGVERRVEQVEQKISGCFHQRAVKARQVVQRDRILNVRDRYQLSQHPREHETGNTDGSAKQRKSDAAAPGEGGTRER